MGFPTDIGVVDLLVGLPPEPGEKSWTETHRSMLKDRESLEAFEHPASYMFKDLPDERFTDDPINAILSAMDHYGVEKGMIGVKPDGPLALGAVRDHPDRFIASFDVDPNAGMAGLRALRHAVEDLGVKAATSMPAGTFPQRAADDPAWYPLYAMCVELGIPIFLTMGVPGPRVPFAPQHVECLDRVCYEFPELTVVTRHGCEPWEALAVKLMLKWPNLYYSTSAFAPKYYPKAIIDYANTRGADKVMYAGYFPFGISYETTFSQLPNLPLRDHVWPKFLRENAMHVLGLTT